MKKLSGKKFRRWAIAGVVGVIIFLLEHWTYPGINSQGTIKLYDKYNNLIYEYASTKGYKRETKLEELNSDAINAVLATEDKRFYQHPGIDPLALARAVRDNLSGRPTSGASTITQQLVRKTSFDGTKMSNNYLRKVREIMTAIRLELSWSKNTILESYLNEMYFGNRAYGIESASNIYFGKSASNLTLAESAFLTSIIASPSNYDPLTDYRAVKARQEEILRLMEKDKLIDSEEMEYALTENVVVDKLYTLENAESYHFADYVLKVAKELPEVKNYIDANKSLSIYTTLDLNKQKDFLQIAKYNLAKIDARHNVTNTSVILLANQTGAVEVMAGGIDYFDGTHAGSVNMTTAMRQPGSAIKPITYALAFREGYYPSYIINDEKTMYITKDGNGYVPQNYDNIYHGRVSLRTALASSFNAPAVELLSRIGTEKFIDLAKSMGIETYNENANYDLAITLGGGETTLLDLTNVYATFAREGNFVKHYVIEEINAGDKNELYKRVPQQPSPILGQNGPAISYLITDILSDPKARMLTFGEKNMLNLTKKTAVKTGTTSNWNDVWTIGYNKTYTLGVWAGNNDNSPMIAISGITGAAPIWNAIFEKIYQTESYQDFNVPMEIESRQVCNQTGLPQECPNTYTDLFIRGQTLLDPNHQTQQQNTLEIVNPRQNAVFQLADGILSQSGIALEVKASENMKSVKWLLNDRTLATTEAPFSYNLPVTKGKYSLKTVGTTSDGKNVESGQVDFEVL